MERERKAKVLAVIAVCISVISLTVGFAALSETLSIGGTAKVEKASWNVHFDTNSLSAVDKTTTAVATTPTLQATQLTNFNATLKMPGDYVSYTFDVVNEGLIDAIPITLPNPNPTCEGTATDQAVAEADAAKVCANLEYTLTYSDGTTIAKTNDDVLAKTTGKKTLKLTLKYKDFTNKDQLPTADVNITNLDLTLIYGQK